MVIIRNIVMPGKKKELAFKAPPSSRLAPPSTSSAAALGLTSSSPRHKQMSCSGPAHTQKPSVSGPRKDVISLRAFVRSIVRTSQASRP